MIYLLQASQVTLATVSVSEIQTAVLDVSLIDLQLKYKPLPSLKKTQQTNDLTDTEVNMCVKYTYESNSIAASGVQ